MTDFLKFVSCSICDRVVHVKYIRTGRICAGCAESQELIHRFSKPPKPKRRLKQTHDIVGK